MSRYLKDYGIIQSEWMVLKYSILLEFYFIVLDFSFFWQLPNIITRWVSDTQNKIPSAW